VVDDGHGGRATSTVTVAIHGVENPQPTPAQELLDSFDDPLFTPFSLQGLTAHFELRGAGALKTTFVPMDGLGRDLTALHATHLDQMAVLEAGGSSSPSIETFLSNDVLVAGRPLVRLAEDIDHTSPNAGAALRTQLVVTGRDVVDGHVLLAFDWNFVAHARDRSGSGINDFAVFTVSEGSTSKLFELSDARTTDWGSSGWRTSVYDITHDFAFNAYGEIRLTVGFAVLNDQTPDNPSHLLLDNVRLNRPLGADFGIVSGVGDAFETYRQSPTALFDSLAATEDAPATVTAQALLVNDFPARGIDGSTLRITGVDGTDTQGAVTFANGQVTYDPRGRLDFLAGGEIGTDTFRYTVTDANGGTDQGEVTVGVTGLNDAPVAHLDSASAVENGAPITIDVLANDDDVDSDDDRGTLRIVAASAGSGALVSFAGAAGAGIVYHPSSTGAFAGLGIGETGTDAISYTIEDSHGARASGSVSVIVAGRNDAPTAGSDQGETDEDTAVTLAVLANDTDPDLHDRLSMNTINGTATGAGRACSTGFRCARHP
jgi:VCBS repeat-containing protein